MPEWPDQEQDHEYDVDGDVNPEVDAVVAAFADDATIADGTSAARPMEAPPTAKASHHAVALKTPHAATQKLTTVRITSAWAMAKVAPWTWAGLAGPAASQRKVAP
jgi:hypothetical protein